MANRKKRRMSIEDIMLSVFVGVESTQSFAAFEPSVFTIQALAVPQAQQDMIRRGYIPAVTFSLGLSSIVGYIRKTWLPVAVGIGTSIFMIGVYEYALRTAPAAPASGFKKVG